MNRFTLTLSALGLSLMATTSYAADCALPEGAEDAFDLELDQVAALYDCVEAKMVEGYAKSDDPVATEYRNWVPTATQAAAPGAHSSRLLFTYANDVAAEQYLKYAEEGVVMPVGSVLAKESVSISKKKKTARPGPLFLMTKVAAGVADETDGWVYGGVQPNGKPMKFKQSFCHNCHVGFEGQDAMGYPDEDVRLSSN